MSDNVIRINAPKPATPSATPRVEIPAAAAAGGLKTVPDNLVDDDIYKRSTTLLDTSSIPISAAPTAPSSGPGTIRISNPRPTVRLATPAGSNGATYTPGAAAPSSGRPTIRLNKGGSGGAAYAGGGSSTPIAASDISFAPSDDDFAVTSTDDGPGGVWAVLGIVATLVAIGVIVVQIMTNNIVA